MNYNTATYKISVIVLLGLTLFYLVVYAIQPDSGLSLQPHQSGWLVDEIENCSITPCPVQAGDVITAVGNITFEASRQDRRLAPFTQRPGEIVVLELQRGAESLVVDWQMPLVDGIGLSRLLALLYVAPFLLAAGFIAHQVPSAQTPNPYGKRLFVIVLLSYALFLASGVLSFTLLAGASLVSHALAWLQAGTMIELHWEIPERLENRHLPGRKIMYLVLSMLALMELFQVLPWRAYYLACTIQVIVPGLLLFWRAARGIAVKPSLIMLAGMTLAWLPAVFWMVSTNESMAPNLVYTAFVSVMLVVWPFFYIYANYRQNLSASMENLGRQWIVVLSFTSLAGITLTMLTVSVGMWQGWTPYEIVNYTFVGIGVLLIASILLRPFERLVNYLLYGQSYQAIARVSRHMAENLTNLGEPQGIENYAVYFCKTLQIQKCAIYVRGETGRFALVFAHGGVEYEDVTHLGKEPRYIPPGTTRPDWVRLLLPLLIRDDLNGYWLLGARADDEYYTPKQVEMLRQLASGLAAALEIRRQRDSLAAQLEVIVSQERMAALGRMAASIAHQINNPLQVLVGTLEAYGGYGNPGLQNHYLVKAHETALYLGEIVSSITMFLRPLATRQELVNVNASVQTAVMLADERLKEQKVELNLRLGPAVQIGLTSPSDLIQVLTNMIDNACDAMNGNGRLAIETAETDSDVVIRVADNGSGMSEEQLTLAFEPFFTTKERGSGFGLALALSIIERNGGKIQVSSKLNEGSTFEIIVPK